MVFDIQPGVDGGPDDCRAVALNVKALFDQTELATFPKTGAGGIQVYVPLDTAATPEDTRQFATAVADTLERVYPTQGRVVVHTSQDPTLAPYSLQPTPRPTVSMPVTWDEVAGDALVFEPDAALARVQKLGDLFAPVLTLKQELPSFD
jgi:bifunctional non-homologous end joining protein LigD